MEIEDPGGASGTVDDAAGSLQRGDDVTPLRLLERGQIRRLGLPRAAAAAPLELPGAAGGSTGRPDSWTDRAVPLTGARS